MKRFLEDEESEESEEEVRVEKKKSKAEIDPKMYKRIPRQSAHLAPRVTDIYVTRRTNFYAQYKRGKAMVLGEGRCVFHGMGAAVDRCAELALRVERACLPVRCARSVSIHTVLLTDDYIPLRDDLEPLVKPRRVSSLRVEVKKVG